ncbi:beta-1,6-N-acetylglucosaminyltransferase [Geodermatophilus sp. SYSU D00758]
MNGAHAPVLACVVMAHADPGQTRRLVAALDPFPVFLHCDARTAQETYEEMTRDLPGRVTLLDRRPTPWGSWGSVLAEVDGYRAALDRTAATHVALLTGSDYPIASSAAIAEQLTAVPGRSLTDARPLPLPQWRHGGFWRLRYRFRAWGKRMLVFPVPRRLPRDVTPAGGSQLKILARQDAEAVVQALDNRPDLACFWRSTWIPDETFVPSVLLSPSLTSGFAARQLLGTAWFIRWDDAPRKSPPWLTTADLPDLRHIRDTRPQGVPVLFARKFSSEADASVLDTIDRTLRRDT